MSAMRLAGVVLSDFASLCVVTAKQPTRSVALVVGPRLGWTLQWSALEESRMSVFERVIEFCVEGVPVFKHLPLWMHPNYYRRNHSIFNSFERKVYSQHGEDGLMAALFDRIGTCNEFFVEFGVEDGSECNTRYLKESGWHGLWMDGSGDNVDVQREFVTAENVSALFRKYAVPHEFDVLSIDIDGNDLWIWEALDACYQPRLVVVEYNPTLGPTLNRTIDYDPSFVWDKTDYFGASLKALDLLAAQKGYRLVCCNKMGVNAFFLRQDVLEPAGITALAPEEAYYPVNLGLGLHFRYRRYNRASNRMVEYRGLPLDGAAGTRR